MVKVFLTGGAGFIGAYIAKKLIEEGDEVIIYDNFSNYISPLISRYNKYLEYRLSWLKNRVTIVKGDIRHKGLLSATLKKYQPKIVVHLAAVPIATISDQLSEDATEVNLNGTINVIEAIKDMDFVKRFVYTSSSMIYGDFQYVPADEEHPKNPKGVYGATKLSGEIITKSFCSMYKKEYVIIRPSAVYGPTDANKRVSQIFVEEALSGKPLVLNNGGTSKLDFSYVEDVADGFILAIKSPNAKDQTFNITRGEGRSLKEFAEIVKQFIPDIIIDYKNVGDDENRPNRGTLDISKAKKLLGYEPKYSIEKGIEKYMEFFRKTDVLNKKE
ncbi:SDR family NAD(P)-dependent oxidoreductase [Candidatus Woesearchaeota archaeon]|nr:SDR family NAD(P)-dependent oxidoreductase [Candidatus Woesearchaeota archaeon]